MSSMGFIMMNWSSELITQVKRKRKRRQNDEVEVDIEEKERLETGDGKMKCNQHEGEFY